MDAKTFEQWVSANLPRFANLTEAVKPIVVSLLSEARISYLSVDGRTKSFKSCLDKSKRKSYKQPQLEMTDISGVRIIVYFDRDLEKICKILEESFNIDKDNSMNRDDLLKANEVGYRSIHYVCDLGDTRHTLPEFVPYKGMKFEFQVRTVLQHAWAELSHDRNYKFSGKLPRILERKMFLLAGMLEMIDAGFSELSSQVDDYIRDVSESTSAGSLDIEINSLSVRQFVEQWAASKRLTVSGGATSDGFGDVINELKAYGISTLQELNQIIPAGYEDNLSDADASISGYVRDWMIINDLDRFLTKVNVNWIFVKEDLEIYRFYLNTDQIKRLTDKISVVPDDAEE